MFYLCFAARFTCFTCALAHAFLAVLALLVPRRMGTLTRALSLFLSLSLPPSRARALSLARSDEDLDEVSDALSNVGY